ncbi:MAG: GNAT family N-acetyltransferase [Chloroflexia bacterium]
MCATPRPPFRIERLADHDREAFSCGEPDMDRWFHETAPQHNSRGLAVVQVLVEDATGIVVGFYSLGNYAVRGDQLPKIGGKKMPPNMQVPMHLLGRLGVHVDYKRQGLGELLVNHALRAAKAQTAVSASMGVVVDALNPGLVPWYQRLGFVVFPNSPLQLVMKMIEIDLVD